MLVAQLVILGTTLGYLAYCALEVIIKTKQANAIAKNAPLHCVEPTLAQHLQKQWQLCLFY